MNKLLTIIFSVLLICGCHRTRDPSTQNLLRVWGNSSSSVEDRARAVDQCFPHGTPISSIVSVLGSNYTQSRRSPSMFSVSPGNGPQRPWVLIYDFDDSMVIIGTSGPLNEDPLLHTFTGAGTWDRVRKEKWPPPGQ